MALELKKHLVDSNRLDISQVRHGAQAVVQMAWFKHAGGFQCNRWILMQRHCSSFPCRMSWRLHCSAFSRARGMGRSMSSASEWSAPFISSNDPWSSSSVALHAQVGGGVPLPALSGMAAEVLPSPCQRSEPLPSRPWGILPLHQLRFAC